MKPCLHSFKQRLMMNQKAFEAVKNGYCIGMSEQDIKKLILNTWDMNKMDFSGDIAADGRIEGDATAFIPQRGNTLILDLQPGYDDCFADTTRTFFLGEPSPAQRHAYQAVIYTLEQMESILTTHPKANEVYFVMQDALGTFGYSCPHHAGHALGVKKLMEPRLIPECSTPLTPGMLIAMEPGVYCDGWGIRMENNYLLTEDGIQELFQYPLDMQYFILKGDKL